jgi:hypothetical protein
MALIATPARRRLAMIALLVLAASGGVVRWLAPDPSTLRDIGTLLLVLWLPAVGNLIAYFVKRIPRSAPPATDFAAGAAFAPQLSVQLEPVELQAAQRAALDGNERRCTLLVGRHGFTARLEQPVSESIARNPGGMTRLQLLHPTVALRRLTPGTEFHVLAGTIAIAKGRVLQSAS